MMKTMMQKGFVDFYPRPPRGGRPQDYIGYKLAEFISIHALREEGDQTQHIKEP